MTGRLVLAAALTLVVATAASAAPINRRQANQRGLIRQGVATGTLTPRETARLASEQRAIAAEERWYRRDGLQPWERADLQRDLNRSRRHIALEKHDGQRR